MLNKQAALVLGLVGAAFVLLGVILGAMPVKSDGFNCGSAFAESGDLRRDEFLRGQSDCDEARSSRQVLAWAPIGMGAFVAFTAFALSQVPAKRIDAVQS